MLGSGSGPAGPGRPGTRGLRRDNQGKGASDRAARPSGYAAHDCPQPRHRGLVRRSASAARSRPARARRADVAAVTDVIEVSYTGDLLAHRRCARAWAYEKRAGFQPYEVVQAMEGRLVHHAMEWLTRQYQEELDRRRHVTDEELRRQLDRYFKVLWARGIRTTFESKQATLDRVVGNLFPRGQIDLVVKAVVEGALHTEYELRAVKKVMPADAADFAGK